MIPLKLVIMRAKLISQIDINHWTVLILEGEWKDRIGDYKSEEILNFENGQIADIEVEHYPKFKEPSTNGYCGKMRVKTALKK